MPTCIVIPIYQKVLSKDESFSLRVCRYFFEKLYDIYIISPKGLALPNECHGLKVINFDEGFFASIQGYNKLCLSAEFYSKFLNYRKMLIYQTDAIVFSDNLAEWIDSPFDYIGAPWSISDTKFLVDEVCEALNLKRFLATRWLCALKNRTGNGGLSLRNIESHLHFVEKYKTFIESSYRLNEDVFFSIYLKLMQENFLCAPVKQAAAFSLETYPSYFYQKTGKLPFGTHAYGKYEFDSFWKPHVDALKTRVDGV